MTQTLTPMRPRIVLADSLRGFALMGLYIVHMVEYFELYWYKPEPGWVHNLIFFLFGGKAYGLFALLFGLSFFIILDNYQRRGQDFRLRFCWRLTVLLVFGYLHSLLYAGDILQLLALCGFLLVLSHHLSTRCLIGFAAFFLIQIPQIILIILYSIVPEWSYPGPRFPGLMMANFEVFAHADLPGLLRHNLMEGQWGKWAFFLETGRLWNIIGLMFVGAVLGRSGFFEKTDFKATRLMIYLMAAVVSYLVLWALKGGAINLAPDGMPRWAAGQVFTYYENLALIAAGVFLFILLFNATFSRRLLMSFAPAGRLTLTFYIAQSLVFVPVYYGFGLAAYSFMGQVPSLLLGVACWLIQMVLAWFWLRNFRYGPLEWVWRKLTFIGFNSVRTN